ncbi:MAG TPA: TraM recognition domain-containing protein, partial [Acidimicrobiales bacterium]|nr:TraM recognition domain-containing protein [Acidimicrobiales bacterium]
GWSPVAAARGWDGAVSMARAMVSAGRSGAGLLDGNHWTERAEALLAPLLHAAALEDRPMADLVRWVNRREPATAEAALGRGGAELAGDSLAGVVASERREQSGIWSTAAGVLAAYRSQAALESAARPSADFGAFVGSADTIYVCAGARQQALVAPLVVGLVEDVRASAYDAAAGIGPRPDVPVLLALDELANVAPLPELPAIVSEGGSQGLVTLACLQDLSQARARWGAAADGFPTLFGAKVVLGGIGDVRTLEAISMVCGDADFPVRSASGTWGASGRRQWTVTWSTNRRRRLPVDELARGHPGCALLLDGDGAPAWMRLTPWHSTEPWRTVAAEGRAGLRHQLRASRQSVELAGGHELSSTL